MSECWPEKPVPGLRRAKLPINDIQHISNMSQNEPLSSLSTCTQEFKHM